jgi:decaprenylphospho-beta-D-ribofuranose 2-oxidase
MTGMDRMLSFDATTGRLVAEAGVLLADIIATFLPRGWFPLVTPGTKFITLGGAIAADVHGKNHHGLGSFRACVDWVEVMDGHRPRAPHRQAQRPRGFDTICGAMGLTGVILRAAIRLQPSKPAGSDRMIHRHQAWMRPSTCSRRTSRCPTPSPGSTASAIPRASAAAW